MEGRQIEVEGRRTMHRIASSRGLILIVMIPRNMVYIYVRVWCVPTLLFFVQHLSNHEFNRYLISIHRYFFITFALQQNPEEIAAGPFSTRSKTTSINRKSSRHAQVKNIQDVWTMGQNIWSVAFFFLCKTCNVVTFY